MNKCTFEKLHSRRHDTEIPDKAAPKRERSVRKPRKPRKPRPPRKPKPRRESSKSSQKQAAAGVPRDYSLHASPTINAPIERRWEFLIHVSARLNGWERSFVESLGQPKWWRGTTLNLTSRQQALLANIFANARHRMLAT